MVLVRGHHFMIIELPIEVERELLALLPHQEMEM